MPAAALPFPIPKGKAEDGKSPMPPGDYGFSRKFAWWLSDRFGVSWQLNHA